MTTISITNSAQEATLQAQPKSKEVQIHNHDVKPTSKPVGDVYVCTNPDEMRRKLYCAKQEGTCGKLKYLPEKRFLLHTKKAQYAYTCTGAETPRIIREMFGLKDGALRRCDSHIFDANRFYPAGQVVYFYEEDIKDF